MVEQVINFETAKLAKEKGFDIECSLFYSDKNRPPMKYNISAKESLSNNPQYNKYRLAPTQSLLQRWIREVHNMYILVENDDLEDEVIWYFYANKKGGGNLLLGTVKYKTYEEALEVGLQETLKLIK